MDADRFSEEEPGEPLDIDDLLHGQPSCHTRFSEALAGGLPVFQPAVLESLRTPLRRSAEHDEMSSRASLPFCGAGLRLLGRDELRTLSEALQEHFHGYRSETPIRLDHLRRALTATLRLLRKLKNPDEHYIRGNLQLHSGSLEEGISNLIAMPRSAPSSFQVDLALRCFYAVVDDLADISTFELDWIASCLQPVWEGVREDRICWTYR